MPTNRAESARPASGKPCRTITPTPHRKPLPRAYSALCCLAMAGLELASTDPMAKLEFARAIIKLRRAAGRYVRTFDDTVIV